MTRFRTSPFLSSLSSLLYLSNYVVSASNVTVTIPVAAPPSAPSISPSFISFSIEQDRWPDWAGSTQRNEFWFNLLSNLKNISGEATRIRIGADSEDHTNFSPSVQVSANQVSERGKSR